MFNDALELKKLWRDCFFDVPIVKCDIGFQLFPCVKLKRHFFNVSKVSGVIIFHNFYQNEANVTVESKQYILVLDSEFLAGEHVTANVLLP